jgi:lipopolysaccharide export LptBFGC system permease protein LptF
MLPTVFSVLPLLDSNQVVFTLPISLYEAYLPEMIGVSEGQGEKSHLFFWGKMTELFVCFFCLLIGIPWLPLRTTLCPL